MNKNSFSKLQSMFDELGRERQAVEAEIETLKAQRAELDRIEADVLKEGNVEKYEVCKAEKEKLDTKIYVKSKKLEGMATTIDAGTVRKMWAEYAAEFEKDQADREKRLAKINNDLMSVVMEMVQAQDDALRHRLKCCEYINLEYNGYNTYPVDKNFPLKCMNNNSEIHYKTSGIKYPAAVYALSMDESLGEYFWNVIGLRRPADH